MFNIIEEVTNLLSGENMSKISTTIGSDSASTGKAIGVAVPAIVNRLATKAREGGGGEALLGLLTSETSRQSGIANGSILNDMPGFLNSPTASGGIEILQTLFGTEEAHIEKKIGQISGLSTGAIGRLLPMLAPVVLGFVGREFVGRNLDAAGLTHFLSDQQGFMRSNAPGLFGFLEKIDANDDGHIVDDIHRLFGRLTGRA